MRRLSRHWYALATLAAVAGCESERSSPTSLHSAMVISLSGSNFEIDSDANLKVDDQFDAAGTPIDWLTVTEIRKEDQPSGTNDDAFGQGSKEDSAVPTVVSGSVPPNKSDLKFFGVYQEGSTSNGFLNLYWIRVQDPQGTTNMDFEFNQSQTLSANGVTPVRTQNDLLITYDLSKGGTSPVLSLRVWDGTKWGSPTNLTASGKATGSINTSPIPAGESDVGALDARTFGEAQIDLAQIFNNPSVCLSYGSAYLKSRSSDSFTAELKDFIAPVPVNISNCGRVVVKKVNGSGTALAGATFTISPPNVATPPVSTLPAVTGLTGVFCIDHLLIGTQYTIHESVAPSGYDPAPDQTFTPTTTGTCSGITASTTPDLTFTDVAQTGAILITKTRKHAAAVGGTSAHAGVEFTVNGVKKNTDSNGKACFDGLAFGNYTVTETTPTGYKAQPSQTITVDNKASCTDNPYVGETASFVNTPLSNITVSFSSQVTGGTQAKISCTGLTATPADATPNDWDDTSEAYLNLDPGTYTCTVVIDP